MFENTCDIALPAEATGPQVSDTSDTSRVGSHRCLTRLTPPVCVRPYAFLLVYSMRSATDGSTRDARQAGMRLARTDTVSSTAAAAIHDVGSDAVTP
jgi:hypothetical protein